MDFNLNHYESCESGRATKCPLVKLRGEFFFSVDLLVLFFIQFIDVSY